MQEPLGPFQESANTVSLREYGDVLRRRRAIILQTFVIVLVAGVLVTIFQAPTYQASSRLVLEPPNYFINSVNTSDPLAELFRINQQYSMGTQIEMLQTPEVKTEIAKQIGAKMLPAISIRALENTQILEITAEGDNPEAVSATPNALMDYYINKTRKDRSSEVDRAMAWASDQEKGLASTVKRLDNEIQAFKKRNNIIELVLNKNEQITQVNALVSQETNLMNQLALIEARIKQTNDKVTDMKAKGQDVRTNLPTALTDNSLQGIDEKIFSVQSQLRQANKTYVDAIKLNPKDIAIANKVGNTGYSDAKAQTAGKQAVARLGNQLSKAEVARSKNDSDVGPTSEMYDQLYSDLVRLLERRIQLVETYRQRTETIDPIYQGFRDNVIKDTQDQKLLVENLRLVTKQKNEAQDRLKNFPEWERQWTQMQREYDSAARNLQYYQTRSADLALRQTATRDTVQILQKADTPTEPIRPKKAQNIILAGVLGLFFGLCLALLQELFDDRINSPEEAERVLRLPSLGHIPLIEEEGLRLIKDISTFSPLMEAYRSLRTNINFAAVGNQVRSIVITSSVPAEGKSTTVANLAMAMALDGRRVIIVDADLRRPSAHKIFKVDSSPGLTDILVGTHSIDDTIHPTTEKNVMLIPAGSPPPNPAELLGSAAMGKLIDDLEDRADIVLFDSPPALAVADAIVLASRANGVLLVVAYGETKKTSTKKAIETLSRANANILGTVLNRMDGPAGGYYYGKYYVPASERGGGSGSKGGPAALEQPDRSLPSSDSEKGRDS